MPRHFVSSTCQNPGCGKPIIQNKRRTRRYCSPACRQAVYRDRQIPPMLEAIAKAERRRVCPVCSKTFAPRTAKAIYCSEKCRVAGWRAMHRPAIAQVECQNCHKLFTPKSPGQIAMYCSDACKQAAYRKNKASRTAVPHDHDFGPYRIVYKHLNNRKCVIHYCKPRGNALERIWSEVEARSAVEALAIARKQIHAEMIQALRKLMHYLSDIGQQQQQAKKRETVVALASRASRTQQEAFDLADQIATLFDEHPYKSAKTSGQRLAMYEKVYKLSQ